MPKQTKASKRKADTQKEPPQPSMRKLRKTPSSKTTSTATTSKAEPPKPETLFAKYNPENGVLGPEGIEAFCKDLKLDPSDRKVLILAWKMGAKRMGYFSRDEFCYGLQRLGVATPDAVKRALDQADLSLQGSSQFTDFYTFAFRYCLTEASQKIIDVETAVQMLSLVMPHSAHTEPFTEYLTEQTEYKTINMDQWTGYLRFTQEVDAECSNFDEAQAWPLLLDNYVEWRASREQ